MIKIPDEVRTILQALEAKGHEAYVVGGCVRDSLLGLTPHDWDICTSAFPQETAACLPEYRILETGIRHGTVTVLAGESSYEVTTFRLDGTYSDHRRPDRVEFVRSLQEDLKRRDFTVNAMAYHPEKGLIDLFGGAADLKQKIIRCVGNPDRRFEEDALRILRALRFASVYGFEVEETTAQAAVCRRALLGSIAAERIRDELCKLLCGDGAAVMLQSFTGVFSVFLPELTDLITFSENGFNRPNLWETTLKSVANVSKEPALRLAMLLHDIGKPFCFTQEKEGILHFYGHAEKSSALAGTILRRLRLDHASISRITQLIRLHKIALVPTSIGIRRLLSRIGEESFRQLLEMKRAELSAQAAHEKSKQLDLLDEVQTTLEQVLAQKPCLRLKDLAVNGRDLLAAGFPPGIRLGQALQTLLRLVIDGKLENRRDCLIAHSIKEGWIQHEPIQTERDADRDGHQ